MGGDEGGSLMRDQRARQDPAVRTSKVWGTAGMVAALVAVAIITGSAQGQTPPTQDIHALFATAEADGRVGVARKTRPVDARPARPGEVIVTTIIGEGKETQSKPAEAGDMVVRNRCPETGNEEYLVRADNFAERYRGTAAAPGDGWSEYRPLSPEMNYFIVGESAGSFTFTAPWGEAMFARPGDAIVRNPADPADTYRVAAASFSCSYEVVVEAPK